MSEKLLLDTNTFLTPYESYYAPDLAPTFWKKLEAVLAKNKNLAVLDLVTDELLKGKDELQEWIQSLIDLRKINIISHNDVEIIKWYSRVLQFLQDSPLYTPKALREWSKAGLADPWLIATAKAYDYTIITFEIPSGNIDVKSPSGRPKIPSIGSQFGIRCQNLYYLMRQMGIEL
ncbi:MAG: DUF4411 family protein [Megasphaera sp.]|uniref:DUF4411 family protein n=1 Tax=Megasphaera sp. TaxID=2023260 RepID=UPI003F0653D5